MGEVSTSEKGLEDQKHLVWGSPYFHELVEEITVSELCGVCHQIEQGFVHLDHYCGSLIYTHWVNMPVLARIPGNSGGKLFVRFPYKPAIVRCSVPMKWNFSWKLVLFSYSFFPFSSVLLLSPPPLSYSFSLFFLFGFCSVVFLVFVFGFLPNITSLMQR